MIQEDSDLPKLASPAQRALAGEGIRRLSQLTTISEEELAQLHGIGPNAIKTLRIALKEKGLSFRANDPPQAKQTASCGCLTTPYQNLTDESYLGMDANFAEVSRLTCPVCGQQWLRYLFEFESITASGRWYLGAITVEQASLLTAENAKSTLEDLSWYFYGGSYYRGKSGRTAGKIILDP